MRILHSAAGIREAPAARAASPGTDYATTSTEKEVVIKDKKLKQHQTIELGGYRGASNSSTMAEMTVEEITMKANKVTDESVKGVSPFPLPCLQSNQTGINTMVMLDEQGEQLKHVEGGLDKINQDMRQAEKNLTDLSRCCGLCVCPCDRVTSIEHDDRYKRTWGTGSNNASSGSAGVGTVAAGEGSVVSSQPPSIRNGNPPQKVSVAPSGPYISRITNDAREDEMEENLGQVGNIIDNLKTLALDMGTEIDKQNKQIDRITDKADLNNDRIREASQRANKLL
ncbi:synaptosomal-associated protein 23 isoform X1 [Arapaima gigas]